MSATVNSAGNEGALPHVPVLLNEVLDALSPLAGKRIVDGTFGAGGYSRAFLKAGADVIAIDRDPAARASAEELAAMHPSGFEFIAGRFSELGTLVTRPVDAIVLDIGVSSMQLDQPERGFSFMKAGPLDMRMSGHGQSAADIVNESDEAELAAILFVYGEERQSRRIAKAIVRSRTEAPLSTTLELAELIEKTVGRKPGASHPATRSFQALRIAVNAEFDELVDALFAAEELLEAGGILAVVTFHSLEDRIVKRFFSPDTGSGVQSRHLPPKDRGEPRWHPVARAVRPGEAELARNPRARSATLRVGVRTGAPAREKFHEGLGVPRIKGRRAA